jgi:hypothetical protein
MKHLDWRVAGAAGLAAGLTVGGFSLVSASSVDRAVRTVELREIQATPTADPMLLVVARATIAPTHVPDPTSPAKPTVTSRPSSSEEPHATPAATPHATPQATANHVDGDDCADCIDGVHCADSVDSVASVDSAASVASVDSDD